MRKCKIWSMSFGRRPLSQSDYSNASQRIDWPGSRMTSPCLSASLRFTWRAFQATSRAFAALQEFDASQASFNPANPETLEQILAKHESSLTFAEEYLRRL